MTRQQAAQQILNWEARRDKAGKLKVYALPKNDGGGTFEVAGINDRYHGPMARKLRSLINAGKHVEAEKEAVEYIAKYTDGAENMAKTAGVRFFLRDSIFNRGPAGATKILQLAVGTKPDGALGPITKAAAAQEERFPPLLIAKLRKAREAYENIVAPGRANLRAGLIARWDKAYAAAAQVCA